MYTVSPYQPLQCYYTLSSENCQGLVIHSESLYVGGCVSLGNVLRLQQAKTFTSINNTYLDLFTYLIILRVFHNLILSCGKVCGK
jgi:hypothetical protein